jgi:hypothetical protein
MNLFDQGWAAMAGARLSVMEEDAVLNGVAVKVSVLRLGRSVGMGVQGGLADEVDGRVEISRGSWLAAHAESGSTLVLRGVTYAVRDEPVDSADQQTVVLTLDSASG